MWVCSFVYVIICVFVFMCWARIACHVVHESWVCFDGGSGNFLGSKGVRVISEFVLLKSVL